MKTFWVGQRIRAWMDWLTDTRLARLNHLRYRAGLEDLTREEAARLICQMKPNEIDEMKARVAE